MNTLKKPLSVIFLASTFMMAACTTSAYNISDIDSGVISTSSVFFSVNDKGVATLSGVVDSYQDLRSLESAAAQLDGVIEVRSYLSAN